MNFESYEEQLDILDFYIHLTRIRLNDINNVLDTMLENNDDLPNIYKVYLKVKCDKLVKKYINKYKINSISSDLSYEDIYKFFNSEKVDTETLLNDYINQKENVSNEFHSSKKVVKF